MVIFQLLNVELGRNTWQLEKFPQWLSNPRSKSHYSRKGQMKAPTTCPPHQKNEPKAVTHPQVKFRDRCYPQRLRIIMNYHKFNQVVIPTAAAIPDVLSLMKQINEASVIIYNQKKKANTFISISI